MLFGNCPYDDCDEPMYNPSPENMPAFEKTTCKACGRTIWLYHSRIDPKAYTETGFLESYDLDEENRSVRAKPR